MPLSQRCPLQAVWAANAHGQLLRRAHRFAADLLPASHSGSGLALHLFFVFDPFVQFFSVKRCHIYLFLFVFFFLCVYFLFLSCLWFFSFFFLWAVAVFFLFLFFLFFFVFFVFRGLLRISYVFVFSSS